VKTRLILKPGQQGTRNLLEKYGEALLCVRFRYDAELRQRLKTVELIVERTEWTPPPPRYSADTLVPLRIEAADIPMRAHQSSRGKVESRERVLVCEVWQNRGHTPGKAYTQR